MWYLMCSQKPPFVVPTSLLFPHTKVSGKLGTNPVNLQIADTCPYISVGTEWCPAPSNVLVSAIVSTRQGHPRRKHIFQNNISDLGSRFPLSVGQKGVCASSPMCLWQSHVTSLHIVQDRDNEGLPNIIKITLQLHCH